MHCRRRRVRFELVPAKVPKVPGKVYGRLWCIARSVQQGSGAFAAIVPKPVFDSGSFQRRSQVPGRRLRQFFLGGTTSPVGILFLRTKAPTLDAAASRPGVGPRCSLSLSRSLSVPRCASLCLAVPPCASLCLSVPLYLSLFLSVSLCVSLCLSVSLSLWFCLLPCKDPFPYSSPALCPGNCAPTFKRRGNYEGPQRPSTTDVTPHCCLLQLLLHGAPAK